LVTFHVKHPSRSPEPQLDAKKLTSTANRLNALSWLEDKGELLSSGEEGGALSAGVALKRRKTAKRSAEGTSFFRPEPT